MADPFVPPPQPYRRWRYPGQNFAMIEQNRKELDWSERTRSWVNDVPAGDQWKQHGKRKVLEQLYNKNDPSTQDCEVSSSQRRCLPRRSKRMAGGPSQEHDGVENPADPKQQVPKHGRGLSSSKRGPVSNRGRPRGSRGKRAGAAGGNALPTLNHISDTEDNPLATTLPLYGSGDRSVTPVLQPLLPMPLTSSPTKTPTSPSKKSLRTGTKWITKQDLSSYEPAIVFRTYKIAKQRNEVTEDVLTLWEDFIFPALSNAPIPSELLGRHNSLFNTPRKSRAPPPENAYASRPEFSGTDLSKMFDTVKDISEMVDSWGSLDIYESTWSDLFVSPLMHLPRKLEYFEPRSTLEPMLAALDIRAAEISPETLFPSSENLSIYKALDRKIDFVMGLQLPYPEQEKLAQGNYLSEAIPSINQTSGFTRYIPMFLNVEIKKQHVAADPLVQLAVWIAAEFKKRSIEGYSRSMPVVAITIEGHIWQLYVAYEPEFESTELKRMVFLGPISMGSTNDFRGIWSIVHLLIAVAQWGRTCYKDWFWSKVLSRY